MLDRLLSPRAVAIVGASQEPRRAGGQPLVGLTQYGYGGKVYPVNPRYAEINGLRCYPRLSELPGECDLALVAVPAGDVPGVIEECGAAGISHAVVFSAGFREIGEKGAPQQERLDAAIARSGVRVVGPNCVGVLNLGARLFAGFGAGFRNPDWRRGPVAMISQSGGFAYSIVSFCQEQGVGIDYMVSTGNEADLGTLDFIEYFLEQDDVRLVAAYVEGVKDGRRLRTLGRRALEVGKPIAVWKVGNTAIGKRAAISHTANLTEDYDFYRDAFREGGFIEVREVYDLIDAAKAFRSGKRPAGRRLAVVTTSGGAGVLIADRCEEAGIELPLLSDAGAAAVQHLLPEFASVGNPVDLTAALAQTEPKFAQTTALVAADPNIDLVILRSYPGRDAPVWADNLITATAGHDKPLLVSLSGTPGQSAAWAPRLDDAGIACYEAPTRAVAAAAMLCDFAERSRQRRSSEPQPRVVAYHSLPLNRSNSMLDEDTAKQCLQAYGIPAPRRIFLPLAATCPQDLDLKFPLAVKIVSPDIAHKTEAGGVRLGVTREGLDAALHEISTLVARHAPQARLSGFLLEEMATGVEILLGALNNPAFGPLVVVGMGGIHTEVFRDVARRYAPFGVDEARKLVLSLKGARLLQGYRGSAPADLDALCDAVARLSWLIADHEDDLAEVEINPLLVGQQGQGLCAVDAIIRLKSNS